MPFGFKNEKKHKKINFIKTFSRIDIERNCDASERLCGRAVSGSLAVFGIFRCQNHAFAHRR